MCNVDALIQLKPGECILWYGNPSGADRDGVAIVHEEALFGWDFRGLDLLVVGLRQAERLVDELDPRIIEPLLTHHDRCGASDLSDQLKERLERTQSSQEQAAVLLHRATTLAKMLFVTVQACSDVDITARAGRLLTDCGFALSLFVLGRRYMERPQSAVLLAEVEFDTPPLSRCRALLHRHKRGQFATAAEVSEIVRTMSAFVLAPRNLSDEAL